MRLAERHEVLESVFVEMDPVLDGFCSDLVELVGVGEGYVLLETAVGTGDCIPRFTSESPDLACAFFEAELGSACQHPLATHPSPRRSSPRTNLRKGCFPFPNVA